MANEDGLRRESFLKLDKWKFNRCLAPGDSCQETAIRAHTVQNARTLDLLARKGHVKAVRHALEKDNSLSISLEDVGRNKASTFEGFCSKHDRELFAPIDTKPIDMKDSEQLFLLAYRSVARETHTLMEAASKSQSLYNDRVTSGLDTGLVPEPAGMLALEHMIDAYETWKYKSQLDDALLQGNFDFLKHDSFEVAHGAPCIAVSSCFMLGHSADDDSRILLTINLFPISAKKSLVIFSFEPQYVSDVRRFIRPILSAHGYYQKYLVSNLVLSRCENFVVSPDLYDTWPQDKVAFQMDFFRSTLRKDVESRDQRLFLFDS